MNTKGINFKHLTVENGRSFKKVSIPLENQGIVLIQGDNGVGKTSIWDLFEAVLYGSTPGDHEKDELTKNDLDAAYTVTFEKNDVVYAVSLKRKKGKWSYTIQKDSVNITEHTYKDAIAGLPKLIGLTKAEFEGSVHLTQEAQHILIKSKLADRKKYISNFFGIDDRYDQIHLAAKQEAGIIDDQISKLSGLSHAKQMLETELSNLELKDIDEIQTSLTFLQTKYDEAVDKLNEVDKKITTWQEYHKLYDQANLVKNPTEQIKELEKKIVDNRSKLNYIKDIKARNEQAYKVNNAIDELEKNQKTVLLENPQVLQDAVISDLEKELQILSNIKNQNSSVETLRKEILALPKVNELPIEKIEKSLLSLQLDYQTHAKIKKAKERGICTECGSKFNVQDVQTEVALLAELRESIDQLTGDFNQIKDRNTKVKRRKLLEEHLAKVPEFSEENQKRIEFLERFIPAKREYDELTTSLKILSRMDITETINADEITQIHSTIEEDMETMEDLKKCEIAKKLLPKKPKESEETLAKLKMTAHNEIHNIKTSIQNNIQTIGEYKTGNESYLRLSNQLNELNNKLTKLDDLKKEEFFWAKMVDAYGPKGLRIQQLEKMMDLIIQQLPVYCSILFKEKRLVFKHKVDPNNVKILAHREEVDEVNQDEVNSFQHDISAFSGGEKDLMSASFILTLADCVPHHKKANILILDEVDAQLDAEGKYRYTNQLLPMLRKKHDSIFVISHNKEVQLANVYDQVWEITKTNHNSTIKMTKINQYN